MPRTKIKKVVAPVPQNSSEAAEFLARLGSNQRNIELLSSTLNAAVEQLQQQYFTEVAPLTATNAELLEGLYAFAQSNRHELTEGGKSKTVHLATGDLLWRFTPPSVKLTGVDAVKAAIKDLKLHKRFIRTKEEVNKEAMLQDAVSRELAATIPGVSIESREEFVAKPTDVASDIVGDVVKLAKATNAGA